MVKRKAIQTDPIGITTIGLDIGYGEVKAVTARASLQFPSLWARASEMKFKTSKTTTEYPGDQITDDEGDWMIGKMAQKHAGKGALRSLKGRTADETTIGHIARVRLAKAALGKLFPNQRNGEIIHVRIATGLPVDHMDGAADFKAALIGQHRIKTDQTDFVANVTEVMVMPQPYGTIYREMITETGKLNPCHTATRTGVVDIGRYTIDVALDDDGEYLKDYSGTIEGGVHRLQESIAADYERRFNAKPFHADVETIIRNGCVRVGKDLVDFTDVLKDGIQELYEGALNLMSQLWTSGVVANVIYISGGGAVLVVEAIKAVYPQAQLCEDAQLANAQGYFNYAMFEALSQSIE